MKVHYQDPAFPLLTKCGLPVRPRDSRPPPRKTSTMPEVTCKSCLRFCRAFKGLK